MSNIITKWIIELQDRLTAPARKLQESGSKTGQIWEQTNTSINTTTQSIDKFTMAAVAVNQTSEIIQRLADSFSFAPEIQNLQANIQRMTGAVDSQLEDLTQRAYMLSSVFGEDSSEIAKSANALSKSMGISFTQAFDLIEKGFEKGANLNGDMLDQLKEYGPQMKQAGLSAGEMIALMAKAGKDGVFSDKALDSIKEANMALREMGPAQEAALKGIGLSAKAMKDKTSFEFIQMISKNMQGASVQAKQLVLTDIFKGAGEDAGLAWISGLSSVDMDVNKADSIKQAGSSIKRWQAQVKVWFTQSFETFSANAQFIASTTQGVAGMILIYNQLASSQKIVTAATAAWNVVLWLSPIMLIVGAIALLIAGLVYAYQNFDSFRKMIDMNWAAMKGFGTLLKDFVIDRIKTLLSGLGGLAKALYQLFTGDFEESMNTGKQAILDLTGVNTIKKTLEGGKALGKSLREGYKQGVGSVKTMVDPIKSAMQASNSSIVGFMKNMGNIHGSAYVDTMIKKAEQWAKYLDKINNTDKYTKKLNEVKKAYGTERKRENLLDGKVTAQNGASGSKNSGLNIDGSSGGNKAITMNLEIKNYFNNLKQDMDVVNAANKVASIINDRLRDAAVAL